MRNGKILIISALLNAIIIFYGKAQTPIPSCELVEKSRPKMFLTFDHLDASSPRKGTKKRVAVFRVQNNSTCNLMLIADSPNSLVAFKKTDGGVRFERSEQLPENTAENLNYELILGKNKKRIQRDMGHFIGLRLLPAKKTTMLRIWNQYFEKHAEIVIAIEYWVEGKDAGKKDTAELLIQTLVK